MAKLKQDQLTLFLKGSDTETQPVEEERESKDSVDSQPPTKKAKHRESGFDQSWHREFVWAVMEEDEGGQGMFCSLCRKHNQTTKQMIWIEIPCRPFRKDKLLQHQRSKCHMDSVLAESHAAASRVTGGIQAALQEQVSMQHQGVNSALKCIYWLVKEEIAHHTKFGSLLELAKSIGCPYLSELEVSKGSQIYLAYDD